MISVATVVASNTPIISIVIGESCAKKSEAACVVEAARFGGN